MKAALGVITALVLVAAAAAVVPLNPYLDFQVLFHADLGLLQGITVYDHAGQVEMIARLASVPAAQVYVLPFPYPPWYALVTVWLAALPVAAAVRLWFGLNLLMLTAAVALLTHGQSNWRRGLLILAGVFWLPSLGSLFVGQYGFPVLLGAASMVHSLRTQKPVLVGVAAALLTFKPHLGLVILIAALLQLWGRRTAWSRRAILAIAAAGVVLFGLGFLASSRWLTEYAGSLVGFQAVHGVEECTQCISLPMAFAQLGGASLGTAAWIAVVITLAAGSWIAARWREVSGTPLGAVAVGVLVTLLASPYLLNYDYVMLLIPWIGLAANASSRQEWLALGSAYVLPAAGIAVFGSAGDWALLASTGIVALLMLKRIQA